MEKVCYLCVCVSVYALINTLNVCTKKKKIVSETCTCLWDESKFGPLIGCPFSQSLFHLCPCLSCRKDKFGVKNLCPLVCWCPYSSAGVSTWLYKAASSSSIYSLGSLAVFYVSPHMWYWISSPFIFLYFSYTVPSIHLPPITLLLPLLVKACILSWAFLVV